jgi:3-oxoacyl-[acyl-carrier protein] reductase
MITLQKESNDMVALVTGATRGIGRTIALELSALGYDLALVGRDEEKLAALQAQAEAGGSRAEAIRADLADPSSYQAVIDAAVRRFGGIDVLVNCAGLSLAGPFTEATPAQWDRIFAVNAKAPFFLCQAALPYLKASSKPIVINIASVVGFKGYANQSVYASSKHALTGFTKVFAKEVQPLGIRVHLISPGAVATEMVTKMRPDIDPQELIQPEEIAEIVRFLVTKKGQATIDQFYIRRYSGLAFD